VMWTGKLRGYGGVWPFIRGMGRSVWERG
jgi:hypothetical protein